MNSNSIIDLISAAVSEGATEDQKKAAATACRNLAAALEAQPGQSLGAEPTPATDNLLTMFAMLSQMPMDQVFDLVIAKLRAKLGPAGATVTPPRSYQLPPLKLPGGGGP
jgi:hypothetical protein